MNLKYSFYGTSVFFMLRFLLFANLVYAERADSVGVDLGKEYFVRTGYYRGMLYPHRQSISYYNEDYVNGLAFIAGRSYPEINRDRPPRIGGGVYFSNLGNNVVYGHAFAAYAYFGNYYLPKSGLFNVGSSVSAGLSYNSKTFNPRTNIHNQAIGLPWNAFFMFGLDMVFFQNRNWNVKTGPTLVHMSNGKLRVPNSGLNLYTFNLTVSYKPDFKEVSSAPKASYSVLNNNLKGFLAGGLRQQNHIMADYEFVSTVIVEYTRRVGALRRLGMGLNYFYNTGHVYQGESLDAPIPFADYYYGVHVAYDIVWGKLSFALNPGLRLAYDKEKYPFYFTRVGIRYELLPGVLLNCSLKSNSFVAEYIEWGVGYGFSFE